MAGVVFAVAGPIETRTGGSIYNRRMIDVLRARGWHVDVVELEGAFPEPDARAREAAARAFAAIPTGALVVADGLAFGALPDVAEAHAGRLSVLVLLHLPVAATYGLAAATASRLVAGEQRALSSARGIVITGPGARPLLARYEIPDRRIWLVEPGTDPASLAHGSVDGTLRLLSVATLHPGKGHDLLLAALAPHTSVDWELSCAGSLTRDPHTAGQLRVLATRLGLVDRVHFIGDVPPARLEACYAESDLFVLATRQETYGMAVAEAIARGLPVISTDTGAISTLVGTDAGIVVPPDDGEAFATALSAVLTSPARRRQLAAGARTRRTTLPTWEDAGSRFAEILERTLARG